MASGVTWTKQVSFAGALPLQKLVPGLTIAGHVMGDSGNSDPFPPGHGAGLDKHTLRSQKLLWSTGAGRKQRLHHFWHFNIETV